MNGQMFSLTFAGTAMSSARDIFQLSGGGSLSGTAAVILHSVFLSQNSDLGSSELENLLIEIETHSLGASGTGIAKALAGSSLNNYNGNCDSDQIQNGGDSVHSEYWNIQNSFVYLPPPEQRIVIDGGGTQGISVAMAAPNDSITVAGTMVFELIGPNG